MDRKSGEVENITTFFKVVNMISSPVANEVDWGKIHVRYRRLNTRKTVSRLNRSVL